MATVSFDNVAGTATVTLTKPVPSGRGIQLSLRDLATNRYLTAGGWVNSRRPLVEMSGEEAVLQFSLDQAASSRISDGATVLIEDVKANFRETLEWHRPKPAKSEPTTVIESEREAVPETTHVWKSEDTSPATEPLSPAGPAGPADNGWKSAQILGVCTGLIIVALLVYGLFLRGPADAAPSPVLLAENGRLQKEVQEQANSIAWLKADLARAKERLAKGVGENTGSFARIRAALETSERTIAELRNKLARDGESDALPSSSREASLRLEVERLEKLVSDIAPERARQAERATAQDKRIRELEEATTDASAFAEERAKRVELEAQIVSLQSEIEEMAAVNVELQTDRGTTAMPRFGALAASGNDIVVLTEVDFASAEDASGSSMMECRNFGGGYGCGVRATFQDQCAAIARIHPGGRGTSWTVAKGHTQSAAADTAKANCEQRYGRACLVTRRVCPNNG